MSNLPSSVETLTPDIITEQDLPVFCEYAYDFEQNELILENGLPVYVYGNEALKVWLFKAILTERFKYGAYSDQFGCDLWPLMGEVIDSDVKKSEIKRYITEAVMVNPYLKSIENIDVEVDGSRAVVNVLANSIYEDEVIEVNVHL